MKPAREHAVMQRAFLCAIIIAVALPYVQAVNAKPSSYAPVVITEDFDSIMARMKAAKPEVMQRQMNMLGSYIFMVKTLGFLVSQRHNLTCTVCKTLKHLLPR